MRSARCPNCQLRVLVVPSGSPACVSLFEVAGVGGRALLAGDGKGLWRSTDHGNTWSAIDLTDVRLLAVEKKGHVRPEWAASDNNRRARYYSLTSGRFALGR